MIFSFWSIIALIMLLVGTYVSYKKDTTEYFWGVFVFAILIGVGELLLRAQGYA